MRGKVSLNMTVCILVSSVLAFILALPIAFVLKSPLYEWKMSRLDLSQGSIGSEATSEIPVAKSIDDMTKMEQFTIEVSVLNSTIPLDGTYYWRVKLPSGETVAALIHQDAVQEFEDEYVVRLPIGRWVPWKHTSGEREDYEAYYDRSFTDFSYYVDMEGDFAKVTTESDTFGQVFGISMLLFYALILWVIRREGVKRGWFPPELLKKKYNETAKETQPADDTEKWCLSTYAIWAAYIGNVKLIAGHTKIPRNQNMMAKILSRDWGINNAEEGVDMIRQLTDPNGYNGTDHVSLAWDWCRAMQLIGCFFLCGYIDRQQMRDLSCQVGRKIQKEFSGWEDLCQNYLSGYTRWRVSISPQATNLVQERYQIYQKLCQMPDGPYTIAFKTFLTETLWDESEDDEA